MQSYPEVKYEQIVLTYGNFKRHGTIRQKLMDILEKTQ